MSFTFERLNSGPLEGEAKQNIDRILDDVYFDLECEIKKTIGGTDSCANNHSLESKLHHGFDGSITRKTVYEIIQHMNSYDSVPKNIIEIGSYLGVSARIFLDIYQDATLTSIDPGVRHRCFDKPREIFNHITKKHEQRITIITGFWCDNKSLEAGHADYENISPRLSKEEVHKKYIDIPIIEPEMLNQKYDLCFIDGSHDKKSVILDFENIKEVASNNTIVLFDDYDWPSVKEGLLEIQKKYNYCIKTTRRIASLMI